MNIDFCCVLCTVLCFAFVYCVLLQCDVLRCVPANSRIVSDDDGFEVAHGLWRERLKSEER